MQTISLQARLAPARPPFLLLALSCVGLGLALAWQMAGHAPTFWLDALGALIGGLAAHVAVNALNEYVDFRSGLDLLTQRTPFSGGSGVLPAHPQLARYALFMGAAAAALTVFIGGLFMWAHPERLPLLLPIGLLGLTLVVSYTPWITRMPLLCLVAPGLGFGPVMVLGTLVALTGQMSWQAIALSAIPFFLTNNLLLLNQFPDVEADRQVGRQTAPMVWGLRVSTQVIGLQWGMAGLVLVGLLVSGQMPGPSAFWWSVLGVLCVGLSRVWRDLWRHAQAPASAVPPGMAVNVALTVGFPWLIAAGVLWG